MKRNGAYPNSLHVEGDTVGRDTLVVRRLEDIVIARLVNETLP